MLTRKILDWTKDKFDNIDVNDRHPYIKSFGLGAIEGAIDGAVIFYPILVGAMLYANHKLKNCEIVPKEKES